MQNDTSQKMNWKTSLLLMGISIIGMAFISMKIAITMGSMFLILFISGQLAKWVSTKTSKPIFPALIMGLGLVIAFGWMKWFPENNHTLNGFLTEVGKALAILGAPALMVLASLGISTYWKKHNPPTVEPPAKEEVVQLESEFLKWYSRGTGLLFVGWGVFGYITYLLLKAFGNWYYSNLIDSVIVEPADNALWGIVAIFLGIYISMIVVTFFIKKKLGGDYERQKNYYDFRMGFDNKKAGLVIGLLYAVLIFGLIFINLTLYTRFTENEIAIHRPYWITEQVHSYSEIISIQQVTTIHRNSDGNIFVIEFSDGRSWKTTSYHTGEIPSYYPTILEFASQKSGIPINYIVKDETK